MVGILLARQAVPPYNPLIVSDTTRGHARKLNEMSESDHRSPALRARCEDDFSDVDNAGEGVAIAPPLLAFSDVAQIGVAE